jgi:hypothetical protein
MLNSANYVSDDEVKRVGEQINPDLDLNDPDVRVYYHQVPGAQTHMPDGAAIRFLGGQYSTKNAEIIAFLDKIADKQGSMVFTKTNRAVVAELKAVAEEAAKPAGDAVVGVNTTSAILAPTPGTENQLQNPSPVKEVAVSPAVAKPVALGGLGKPTV